MDETKTYEERYRALSEACKNFLESHDTALAVIEGDVTLNIDQVHALRDTIFEEIEKIRELMS